MAPFFHVMSQRNIPPSVAHKSPNDTKVALLIRHLPIVRERGFMQIMLVYGITQSTTSCAYVLLSRRIRAFGAGRDTGV
ncbi:hypothetical protein BDN70DRAFT_881571 [Pholiota conissans]|uniref:Uncharacterized protein n=1 Tax=Pholiota conissans TaxID=109636 RepID=A0A9P5YZV1_9AGAR|nr:hypothetical protein BDN70DRAFT_881571 [Pholiota conissans]